MNAGILKTAIRCATLAALVIAAAPAAAEIIDTSDSLLQKARPLAFGDFGARKQLCARSGFDDDCRDGLPSVKQDLLQPPSDSIIELPPVEELLPGPQKIDDLPLAVAPAAAASVPEPSAIGLLLLAAAGLATRRARRPRG